MKRYFLVPPVGRRPAFLTTPAKTNPKNLLRGENQPKAGASARLPLVGPETTEKLSERSLNSRSTSTPVQAHSSMRICLPAHANVEPLRTRTGALVVCLSAEVMPTADTKFPITGPAEQWRNALNRSIL